MRKILTAGLVAASLIPLSPQPARAWGGFGFGLAGGLIAGTAIGIAVTHPYGYYPYPYPYAYPAYPAYAYPPYAPPVVYAPTAYAPYPYGPYPYAPYGYPTGRIVGPPAAAPVQPPAPTATCHSGQFYNTLTGTCDRS